MSPNPRLPKPPPLTPLRLSLRPPPCLLKVIPNPPPPMLQSPQFFLPFSTRTEEGVYSVVQVTLQPTFFTSIKGGGANGGYGKLAGRWEGEVNWGDVNYKPPPQSLPTTNKQPSIKGGGANGVCGKLAGSWGEQGGGGV